MAEDLKAFPASDRAFADQGMDLRDWFAGQSLLLADQYLSVFSGFAPESIAAKAYALADALMKERLRANN